MPFHSLIAIVIFLFGLCVGSFLNVVIYRLEQKKNLTGRSFCPHCHHQLFWFDLVPVFSYLTLMGKCRHCRRKISFQYPLVEIATGLIFLVVFNLSFQSIAANSIINLVFLLYVFSSFIVIFIYDAKHYLIPDKVLLPAIVISFIYMFFAPCQFSQGTCVGLNLLGVFFGAGFFFLLFVISQGRWIGFGDVKLAVLMGILLGMPQILGALFIASLLGSGYGLAAMAVYRKGLKSHVPFAPFLLIGTAVMLFFGGQILAWYTKLF